MQIALVGSAPSSVNLAPFKDASFARYAGGKQPDYPPAPFIDEHWQIWGCSPGAWSSVPRADVWFEVHRWEPGQQWFSPQYCQFLREFTGRVYVGGPIPEIPGAVVYPIERVEEAFSAYFLHSSLSLMMALAILEIEDHRKTRTEPEDDTIGLWGVDMAAHEEYVDQKNGCVFFILEALRRDIQVYVPPESCLLRPKPVYGLSEWDHSYIKATARAREMNQRKVTHEQAVQENQRQATFLAGALDNHDYWINTWTSPYGLPAGVKLKHQQGTGLGGGITMPRPPEAPTSPPERPAAPPSPGSLADLGEMAMVPQPKKRKSSSRSDPDAPLSRLSGTNADNARYSPNRKAKRRK